MWIVVKLLRDDSVGYSHSGGINTMCHVSLKYFHISSEEWAIMIKFEKLIILIKSRP